MSYNDQLLDTIDTRIASLNSAERSIGTAISDSGDTVGSIGASCMVLFDGATTATPVKVFGGIQVKANDRVGVLLFGTDWIITNTFQRQMRNAMSIQGQHTPGSMASGTFVNAPGPQQMTFTKHYKNTAIYMALATSCYSGGTTNTVKWAFNMNSVDYDLSLFFFNSASEHKSQAGWRLENTAVDAGTYVVTLRWVQLTGTGGLNLDANDWFSMYIEEVL